jgi:hypothetical protein
MSKTKKARELYVTRDGGAYDVSIWLGKPQAYESDCDSCGNKHDSWGAKRGKSRLLMDSVCLDGFEVSGITLPISGGIVKFSIQVEQ